MQQPRCGLLAEMTAAVLPLVVLVLEHRGEESHQRRGVGKVAHHLGAAFELGVDRLDGIGRGDRLPVVNWERELRKHVDLSGALLGDDAREVRLQHGERMGHGVGRVSGVGCRRIDFTTASTAGACSLGAALATLRRKCTLHRNPQGRWTNKRGRSPMYAVHFRDEGRLIDRIGMHYTAGREGTE
jgi:hypothetical protein